MEIGNTHIYTHILLPSNFPPHLLLFKWGSKNVFLFCSPIKKQPLQIPPLVIQTDHLDISHAPSPPTFPVKKRTKKIQTMFRESSAQTSPWQPNVRIAKGCENLELLKLDFLKWGKFVGRVFFLKFCVFENT